MPNILILGGDTKALAINFVLAGLPGINTTVLTSIPRGAWPYTNGPIRQHGDSPALRDALEYFELGPDINEDGEPEFDTHLIRNALLVGGEYHAIGANLRPDTTRQTSSTTRLKRNIGRLGVDLQAFWRKSRRWPPVITPHAANTFADLEMQAPSAGLQFDSGELSRRLYDYAQPIHGQGRFIRTDAESETAGHTATVFSSLENGKFEALEYDRLILASPQHEWAHLLGMRSNILTRNATILVSARRPSSDSPDLTAWRARADFDVFYPTDTKAIHRVSYRAGRYVCEYNREHERSHVESDLALIFGDSYIGERGPDVLGYAIEPAPSGPAVEQYMKNFGATSIDVQNLTLGEAMEMALEIGKAVN